MSLQPEFQGMICSDIKRIEEADSLDAARLFKLHREIDGRYQACIKDWYKGLWGSNSQSTMVYYNHLQNRPSSLRDNLQMMKSKLETYLFEMNAITLPELPSTQVNVTTNVNISLSFEEARSKIEDMTALSREQTDEIIQKINELEEISKEKTSRKNKWEKVKPIITFALDKGADAAIAILTLIVQMKLGI